MKAETITITLWMVVTAWLPAVEIHVSPTGDDTARGLVEAPLRSISAAARRAQPGDEVIVHNGVYRERIDPPRGGSSDQQRITYRAAEGEKVAIKGSEVVKGWEKVENDTWRVTIPNAFFGDYNPYGTPIAGDWFRPLPKGSDRVYHTGSVYLDGHWLKEAASQAEVLAPAGEEALWFGEVNDTHTTLHAQFTGADPNRRMVEINVRETVFYPEKTGINHITVRGFTLEHAAPNWAPPTAEQVGLIGTHWSKGWVIEDNTIRYSMCTGLTLGKHGDEHDNTSAWSAEGYVETIKRALAKGWSKQHIGSHMIRNNRISHCEQAGIVGSMGAAFSTISGNVVHDINLRGMLTGAEMAGIKFHGAVDTLISHNHVYRCGGFGGIWLDWMTQGTRITGNLLHDNHRQDLFLEVNHGPFLVDHNLFLSPLTLCDQSTGGAYVHNLFAGAIDKISPQRRQTPYLEAHSTAIAGLHDTPGGDNRFLNNLFVNGHDLEPYQGHQLMRIAGNLILDTRVRVERRDGGFHLLWENGWGGDQTEQPVVTSELLERTHISKLPFEQPDGTPYRLDRGYFGTPRSRVLPGPFAEVVESPLKVWPLDPGEGR